MNKGKGVEKWLSANPTAGKATIKFVWLNVESKPGTWGWGLRANEAWSLGARAEEVKQGEGSCYIIILPLLPPRRLCDPQVTTTAAANVPIGCHLFLPNAATPLLPLSPRTSPYHLESGDGLQYLLIFGYLEG